MKAAQRKQFEKLLRALEKELSGKSVSEIAPNRVSAEEVGGDEDEQPLNEMMQAIASNRNRNKGQVLTLVDKALKKLTEEPDEYGLCEECGDEVGPGRLKAMPYAELCVACQGNRDAPRGLPRRKLTEYI